MATTSALTVGCAADGDLDEAVAFRPGGGGVWLNTSVLGVQPLSELDLSGAFHHGVRLDQVLLKKGDDWVPLDQLWSKDGELQGSAGGLSAGGMDLLGSRWELTLKAKGDDVAATLWIDGITEDDGHWRYEFAYELGEGPAQQLCDGEGAPSAVVIPDLTVDAVSADMEPRPDTLYIACTSGAVGKAVEWGYKPWELGIPAFEAVVRVIRADYCGDGVSWTKPGTSIQISDTWAIHEFVAPVGTTEALWGEGGAICLRETRAVVKVECPGGDLPTCPGGASLTTEPGALVWTKLPPRSEGAAPHS